MVDEPRFRSYRSTEPRENVSAGGSRRGVDDPLAELARLIGQEESISAVSRPSRRPQPSSLGTPSWLSRPEITPRRSQSGSTDERIGRSFAPSDSRRLRPDLYRYQEPIRDEPEAPQERADAGFSHVDARDADPDNGTTRYGDHADADLRYADPVGDDAGHGEGQAQYPQHHDEDEAYGGAQGGMDQSQDPRYADLKYDADPSRNADYDGHYADMAPPVGGHYEADGYYYAEDGDTAPPPGEEAYHDPLQDRRRGGLLIVGTVIGLLAVGAGVAFGYRALSGSGSPGQVPVIKADTAPSKVVPAQSSDGQPSKLIYDRVTGEKSAGATEKVVSREEQPVEIRDMAKPASPRVVFPAPPGVTAPATVPSTAIPAPGAAPPGSEPKKVHTITIRPDQSSPSDPAGSSPVAPAPSPHAAVAPAKPQRSPSGGGPLALGPQSQPEADIASPPSRTASVAPVPYRTASVPAAGGGYVVQVSSQRSEDEAQASFKALQAKYSSVLGGRQPIIRRADLHEKGIYYRAQVGPFASSEDANQLCDSLKAAGGQCIVQRN